MTSVCNPLNGTEQKLILFFYENWQEYFSFENQKIIKDERTWKRAVTKLGKGKILRWKIEDGNPHKKKIYTINNDCFAFARWLKLIVEEK
jgi:hypothetical protein